MSKLDRERFIKVCGMMTSQHDGEALAALRKANTMLKEAKLTWAEALNSGGNHSQPAAYQAAGQPRRRGMTPEQKWKYFEIQHPDVAWWIWTNHETNNFANSLYNGVLKFGSLTERQMAAVERNL